ncbi:MAG: ubiquitin-like small modifier protein 1 [Anaerolineales bacterium]
MAKLKIPSPLRNYTGGQPVVEVTGGTVAEALDNLIEQHPDLRQHLFSGQDDLRPFVNLYLNSEDIRHLQQLDTPIQADDRLMIVPSIAGGLEQVDHSALRTNQALIISLSLMAFVLDLPWLVAIIAITMTVGTALRIPGFGFVYRRLLRPLKMVKPDILADNPEPHRFAQGIGALVLGLGTLALIFGSSSVGWAMVWLVIILAGLNLFAGICVGCALYYWLGRLAVPGFLKAPPPKV